MKKKQFSDYIFSFCKSICKILFISSALFKNVSSISFMSIGDWGGASIDLKHQQWENTVAKTFSNVAEQITPKFIVGTGDNFYYYGVKNKTDPLFITDFEEVYKGEALMVPWYHTLGNHDYAYNPEAQTQYISKNNNRWIMPDRYYYKRIKLNSNQYSSFIFLDTSPCYQDYINDDPRLWDPCSPQYPSPKDCKFHKNILLENCHNQYAWLKNLFLNISKDDWIIVAGHHPANQIDVAPITTLLKENNIDLYLNGHAHELRHYLIDGKQCWITTGAGSMVSTEKDQKEIFDELSKYNNKNNQHKLTTIWNQTKAGFTTHTFSNDYTKLTTNFIDFNGDTLYNITMRKQNR